jgi:SH3-like domain-containing protein
MSSGTTNAHLQVSNDLNQLAPLFRAAVEAAIAECQRAGLDAVVYEAYRSQELQAEYYARGRTKKPPLQTVTNAPSNLHSWHGYGLAVDVISRSKAWHAGHRWFADVAAIFKRHNCKWGGDWTRPDLPHFQWHLCKASPSPEARRMVTSAGVLAVWEAVGALREAQAGKPQRAQPALAEPTRAATVTASQLNLRVDPSPAQPPLRLLARGTPLEVLEPHGNWFRVRVDGLEGFVHGDHIALRDHSFDARFLAADAQLRAAALEPQQRIPVPASGAAQRRVAETWNRFGGLLDPLSRALQIRPAAAVAVLCVESGGTGFVNGRMIIRFETHVFNRFWGKQHPELYGRHFVFDAAKPWTGQEYSEGDGTFAPFHGDQAREWIAFETACKLNRAAALRSISMGAPQIMGFNHGAIGYDSVEEMFAAFSSDARFQILGMFDFVKGAGDGSPMVQALQQENYEIFATRYNGSGQAAVYGGRIRTHAEAFAALNVSVTA